MRAIDSFLQEYSTPTVKVGDEILIGKWKNKTATIKGIGKDKNNQPILKTDKGDVNLYHFRIKELMPKKKKTVTKESLEVTPIIKKTRTKVEEYEVCPHCMEEIMEKSTFVDKEQYIYHRGCFEQGPIGQIVPLSDEEFKERMGW